MGGGGEVCPFGVDGVQGDAEGSGEENRVLVVNVHGVVIFFFLFFFFIFFIVGGWGAVFASAF